MALSPADFYAYSNATGIPVPEDPQERARIAPDVIEFRRNQLKAPEQESNPLATLGAIAAGAGALAGLGFGARALLGRGRQIPQGPPKSATAGVRQVNLADMEEAVRRVASEPAPSSPPPTPRRSVMPTEEEAFQQFNRQLSEAIPEPTAAELNFPAATSRIYGAGYRERQGEPGYRSNVLASLEKRYPPSEEVRAARRAVGTQDLLSAANRLQEDAATLTDIQKTQLPSTSNQFFNAVESGEDQITARTLLGVQRNEDVNLAEINALANITGNAKLATSLKPDGVPFDQTEGIDLASGTKFLINPNRPSRSGLQPGQKILLEQPKEDLSKSLAASFLERERMEIASQLGEQNINPTYSRIEQELANRLSGSESWTYGPEYTKLKQAMQLGATYNPRFFNDLNTESVVIAGESIPTSSFYEPVAMESTAQRLQERVNEKKDWLGNIRLQEQLNQNKIYNELGRLSERDQNITDYLNYIESDFPKKSFYSSPAERDVNLKKRYEAEGALIEQEQINEKMSDLLRQAKTSEKRVAGAQRSTKEQIAGLTLPKKLKSGIEEGKRLFFEQDPENLEPIPETLELRSERRMIDTPTKGGGGRKVAEYVGGSRDEGIDIDVQNILESAQTSQSPRYYEPDVFGYVPDLEEASFVGDRTQVGRKINAEGIQLENAPGQLSTVKNPFEQLDTETLQQISLMGSEADSYNATRVLKNRSNIGGGIKSQRPIISQEPTQAARRSVDASRDIMKIMQSSPPDKAQSLVQAYIKNLQQF